MASKGGLAWLCKVSFDYDSDYNLHIQRFSSFVPQSSGGARRALTREAHVGTSACVALCFLGGLLKPLGNFASVKKRNVLALVCPARPGPRWPLLGIADSLWFWHLSCTCEVPRVRLPWQPHSLAELCFEFFTRRNKYLSRIPELLTTALPVRPSG